MTGEAVAIVHKLTKRFAPDAPPALDAISFSIKSGQVTGVAGPDGAGKTTLMRLMAGLLVPTEGSLTVCGYDTIKDSIALHHTIGYMPQRFGLYDDLTVLENLTLYADLRGVVGKRDPRPSSACSPSPILLASQGGSREISPAA